MPSIAPDTSFFWKKIDSLTDEELDALPYGVIHLDGAGTILRYNAFESRLSGLRKKQVIGKNFFKQIAPCTNVQQFYGRFRDGVAAGELHATFRFHFALKRGPREVTITLLYNKNNKAVWVLAEPLEKGPE